MGRPFVCAQNVELSAPRGLLAKSEPNAEQLSENLSFSRNIWLVLLLLRSSFTFCCFSILNLHLCSVNSSSFESYFEFQRWGINVIIKNRSSTWALQGLNYAERIAAPRLSKVSLAWMIADKKNSMSC